MKLDSSLQSRTFRRRRARQEGLTLIESAVALGIVAIMLATFGQLTAQNQQAIKSRAAALQLQQVTNAAGQYIQTNYGQVINNTPIGSVSYIPTGQTVPGGPQPVGTAAMPSLQQAGFLSSTYVDTNPYGQRTALLVTQPSTAPGRIEAMLVTYNGQQIADDELGRIATSVGASGGFIPKSMPAGSGIPAGTILGSYGGWRSMATNWAGNSAGVVPSQGHLMSTLAFQNGALLQDFLYRDNIGNPAANAMNTSIHMQGNGIDSIGTLCGGIAAGNCSGMTIDMNGDSISNLATINAAGSALNLNGSLAASGNVTSGGYVQAGSLPVDTTTNAPVTPTAGGGYFGSELVVGGNTTVNGDGFFKQSLSVDSDLIAGGKVIAKERVLTPRINSPNNLVYEMAPAGLSSFGVINPTLINADTYVFGSSVNRPVPSQQAPDPRSLVLPDSMTQDQKLAAVDAAQDAYYKYVASNYDPSGGNATTMVPLRLGDLLPKYVLQSVYLMTASGVIYNALDPTTGQPVQQTIPVTQLTDSNGNTTPIATIPWPACGGAGIPEMYLSRVDESWSIPTPETIQISRNDPATQFTASGPGGLPGNSGNFVGVIGLGSSANTPAAYAGYTNVVGAIANRIVTDVQVGGINLAPNAQVTADNNGKTWSVVMTPGGTQGREMVLGIDGATQTVERRLMAQTFCHYPM